LLELEVPEIFNGLVEIKSIAREAGQRSKVAVAAMQDGIDPVGACVGQRGVRIQAIVNELSGEKIDVVEWSPSPAIFIGNALSPAKVLNVRLSEDENGDKVATVVVQDKQLSLAIGKEGQNARLAAKLTGWRIDIKSESQAIEEAARRAREEELRRAQLEEAEAEEEFEEVEAEETVEEIPGPEIPVGVTDIEIEAAAAALESQPTDLTEAPTEQVQAQLQQPPVETPEGVVPQVSEAEADKTFEEAWAEFEAEGEAGEDDEREKKRKEDRRKRQTLVYDEKLGKVVAQKKHKGGRAREWFTEEEDVVE
jgi:N utilization substance protein A